MRKGLLILLMFSLSFIYVFAQQDNKMKKVYLSDGTVINAYVEKQPDGMFKLTTEDESVFYFRENEISFSRVGKIFSPQSQPQSQPQPQSNQQSALKTIYQSVKDKIMPRQSSNGGNGISDQKESYEKVGQKVENPKHNGYEYVDLGLSVKWATCNVGSVCPEYCGNYFMWGDVATSFNYSWAAYKYCMSGGKNQTKYSTQKKYGFKRFVDYKSELEPCDDAAHIIWGGEWRMPTINEIRELQSRCVWTWAKLNGINGYKVMSRVPGHEGKYIFLPAVGSYSNDKITSVGHVGVYWSSTLELDEPENAHVLKFDRGGVNVDWTDNRCDGHAIRAVMR